MMVSEVSAAVLPSRGLSHAILRDGPPGMAASIGAEHHHAGECLISTAADVSCTAKAGRSHGSCVVSSLLGRQGPSFDLRLI